MKELKPGDTVSFFDDWKQERKAGVVVAVRRSERNPWKVAIVRVEDGTETEVHPDRIEPMAKGSAARCEARDNVGKLQPEQDRNSEAATGGALREQKSEMAFILTIRERNWNAEMGTEPPDEPDEMVQEYFSDVLAGKGRG